MTSRRGFLGALAAAIASAAVVDTEQLLWTPGKKLISIPAPAKVLTIEEIDIRFIHPAVRALARAIDADCFALRAALQQAEIGQTVTFRNPQRFALGHVQRIREEVVAVTRTW